MKPIAKTSRIHHNRGMNEQRFLHQKQYSLQLRKEPLCTRRDSLRALEKAIESRIPAIAAALAKDFSKPQAETLLTEIYPVLKEIHHTIKNLKKWSRPRPVGAPLGLIGTRSHIMAEPHGVCLIISPWNYPFNLCMAPLISAIAAGNCAFIKPSEFTPHTNQVLKDILQEAFREEHVAIIEGGVDTTQNLLKLPFDHIFFTGSTGTGKLVMEAASRNLSRVTLELGGKSPTIVDSSANLEDAAEKIAWAKFMNAGQTCVAPDYLLVQEEVLPLFKELLIKKIEAFYGVSAADRKSSLDFARIITRKHTERLQNLLSNAVKENAVVSFGGDIDSEAHYVSPTLLEKVDPRSHIMQEEIFGPILPLIPFRHFADVIHFINERPKPLALYVYTHSALNTKAIIQETSSGGLCINDSIIHLGNPNLPFGGIGDSGHGNYHGHFGFKTFSHEKAVLRQSRLGRILRITHPPYTAFKTNMINRLIHWRL